MPRVQLLIPSRRLKVIAAGVAMAVGFGTALATVPAPAEAASTGINKPLGPTATQVGDFNGDGKADVFSVRSSDWAWMISWGGTSFWEVVNFGVVDPNRVWVGDFDGNGTDDLYTINPDGKWYVDYSVATPGSQWTLVNGGAIDTSRVWVGDLNGDGKDDVLYYEVANNHRWLVSYSATTLWQVINGGEFNPNATWLIDMNADGSDDVVTMLTDGRWLVSYSGSGGWVHIGTGGQPIDRTWMGDLNGDSKGDVFWQRAADELWFVSWGMSTGWQQINGGYFHPNQTWLADFNGDGKDDVFTVLPDTRWIISYSGSSAWSLINGGSLPYAPAPVIDGEVIDDEVGATAQIQHEAAVLIREKATPPASVQSQGDAAVVDWFMGVTRADPDYGRVAGWGDWWDTAKCVAAITVTIGSTVFAVAKITKIKKLVKAAGGVKKTATRVLKAFKTTGSISNKAQAAFGDLGQTAVSWAVVLLGIDDVINYCS